MPRAQDLPDDLKELSFRNGVELTHARWDSDVQVLVKALRPYVQAKPEPTTAPAANGAGLHWTRSRRTLGAVFAGLVVLGFGGYAGYQKFAEPVGLVERPTPIETGKPDAIDNIRVFRDWEGAWDMTWEYGGNSYGKPMTLSADQFGITGDYVVGTLKGAFVGGDFSRVAGEIKNVTNTGQTCVSGEQGGRFSLELSRDGRRMEGWWTICDEATRRLWSAVKR